MNLAPSIDKTSLQWFAAMSLITLASVSVAAIFNQWMLVLIPLFLLGAFVTVVNYQILFYGFFFLLPFSIEVYLPGGLGTDLPSEPIMWLLLLITFILILWNGRKIDPYVFSNPISKVIMVHLLWLGITSLNSSYPVNSIKFLLAKLWYVFPFFYLPLLLIKEEKDLEKVFRYLIIGTCIAVSYVVIRHSSFQFSFEKINKAAAPFFRNHVNYAALLSLIIPYVWAMGRIKKTWYFPFILTLFSIALYLTYTRAGYVATLACVPMYFVIKYRLLKWLTPMALIVVVGFVIFMIQKNTYLEYAPNYEKTIVHKKFNNLIEATYKMEDISTMERLYRWVAGFNMVDEHPIFGFGPSTFYNNYERYTVRSFQTYVSDNPEKSGMHNYYLMTAVEQGFIGLFILLMLILAPLFLAERAYAIHRQSNVGYWVLAAALCYFSVALLILINDLLEVDKVGPLFFLSAAIIVLCQKRGALTKGKGT